MKALLGCCLKVNQKNGFSIHLLAIALNLSESLCFNPGNPLSSLLKEVFLQGPSVHLAAGPCPLLPSALPAFGSAIFSPESSGSLPLAGAEQWFELKPSTLASPGHGRAFLRSRPLLLRMTALLDPAAHAGCLISDSAFCYIRKRIS